MSSLLGLLMRTLPRWIYLIFCFVLFFKSASIHSKLQAQQPDRVTTSLNGAWHFYRENDADKKVVNLPTHWETHEGLKFDGTGYYEKTIELPVLNSGRRLLLHFDTVATHATVYWNNKRIGEHLGGWTPFRFDVTDYVNAPPHGALPAAESSNKGEKSDTSKITSKHTIKIHVDEKVGHNTQGFLPIIAPHFGGIWQGIKLIEVPEVYIDDLRISINSNHITIPIVGTVSDANVTFAVFPISNSISNQPVYTWNSGNSSSDKDQNGRVTIPHNFRYEAWSADQPKLYRVVIHLKNGDSVTLQTGFRSIETDADKFLLNKHTLTIRGVLNWGYYPPSLAPTPSEQQWREDIQLIKRWGFNLMKCCLWVPSKRLLEIADEEGIYLWIEYPTWHPKLTPEY
ncbi:MAG TPA: hypothetical protein PKD72_05560, partial [Gemmatales bacterium]|nr:hypothetical protein [Gemmatales bacterium]